jgi:hypothetical protein
MDQLAVGDVRTAACGAWLFEQIVSMGTVVLKDLGGGRKGEMAAHRFLSSPHVSVAGMVSALSARTAQACRGRRVVAVQDTTEINFSGRAAARRGLGPAGDGRTPGFFLHPVVAVDVEEEALLGLVDAQIWTRGQAPAGPRARRPLEDKESRRWIEGTQAAAARLAAAAQVVSVADQEGDIWAHFGCRPACVELLVRARHDRALVDGGSLFAAPAAWPLLARYAITITARRIGESARVARIELRAGAVQVAAPQNAAAGDPRRLDLTLVEAREVDPPPGTEPVRWRLLTTLPAEDAEAAREIVGFYCLRWRIEEVFRALKRDGLRLQESQLQEAERLFRLAALALGAAVRILQLTDARDGSSRPMSDVLDERFTEAVEALGRTCEGGTEQQKNHHPSGSLPRLAWIVARYGGWNCYGKPPGPKTMAKGWQRLCAAISGFIIAKADALV